MKARAKPRPKSIVATLRSGPFVAMLVGCLLLGVAALGRVWHEHRNELLRREVSRMESELKRLDSEIQAWRVRGARLVSPTALEAAVRRLDLDLRRPTEEQFLRVIEPRWEASGTGALRVAGPTEGGLTGPRRSGSVAGADQEVTMR